MTTDSAIIDRLRDAADRIDVDLQLDDLLSPARALKRPPPARSRTPRILAAAACLVLIAGLAIVLATGRKDRVPAAEPAPVWTPPRSLPRDAPEPGAFAAHVATQPAWLGELGPGIRTGAMRTGHWVATAIARPTADGFAAPITVSAFDGTWEALADASNVEIDGQPFLRAQIGDWQALATTTQPVIAAAGNVDEHTLRDVLSATTTTSHEDQFTITLSTMPDGYAELVPPHVLPVDTTPRRALVDSGGALAINEVSDWADPLLYAASTGADISRFAIDTTTGWSGTTTSNPYGTITFLVWSPRPGVLLEIDSTDPGRSIDDLVQLANNTSVIPTTEWDDAYPG